MLVLGGVVQLDEEASPVPVDNILHLVPVEAERRDLLFFNDQDLFGIGFCVFRSIEVAIAEREQRKADFAENSHFRSA